MSDDDLNIRPGAVVSSGQRLTDLATAAKAQNATYFTSQQPAAASNPGFSAGAALTSFAQVLHSKMDAFVDELAHNGGEIVASARSVQQVDADTANGFNREMAALNGLSRQPQPHTGR
ncbi:hypothetical protein [Mycobacteroides abscessus]|uniref:hypothetical protein n=1 Tax=Mycobacteroides abscessus TaxID=36809 RepID=UPI0009263BA0|nr:hypothetical protein [Mycobacteroides abscessus]SHX65530.1 Uncharacterised protein [Mycobacteroides abscessus subsp. abscessus]SHY16335.1 Uncharacterised protein [Mycobacteroides abscessus subsp. abscessus]SIB55611.1 Uncharacterised protein [Mycobacteroides abscessus subsp. abscessus]SIB95183.1 Uncharacterised protein [Mycobacteroides abscessus subsp. abscessus]SIC80174.1 Uncharacterised protein [Mycobacteroides abscessus subsp. abscessus]